MNEIYKYKMIFLFYSQSIPRNSFQNLIILLLKPLNSHLFMNVHNFKSCLKIENKALG